MLLFQDDLSLFCRVAPQNVMALASQLQRAGGSLGALVGPDLRSNAADGDDGHLCPRLSNPVRLGTLAPGGGARGLWLFIIFPIAAAVLLSASFSTYRHVVKN